MARLRIKRWEEWEVPPMWVWVVGSVILIGISTLICWKFGESVSATARSHAMPPPAPTARANPNDPDSF